jgi:hypothetical protein
MKRFSTQNLLYIIFAFFTGAVIGGLIGLHISDNTSKKAFRIYLENELSLEEEEAIRQFKDGTPEVAIYSQERLIRHVTRLKEMNIVDNNNFARIIGFAEGRKGFVNENLGDTNKSKEFFEKAMKNLKGTNISLKNIDELKSLIAISKKKENK